MRALVAIRTTRFWGVRPEGREVAARFLEQSSAIAAALEACGWSAERIQEQLRPSRDVFATSSFMRRCQEWPRGYAGDFETIEYLAAGKNHSFPGSLGWHFEDILLQSAIVLQTLLKSPKRDTPMRSVPLRVHDGLFS